jgi:hypothetical protein
MGKRLEAQNSMAKRQDAAQEMAEQLETFGDPPLTATEQSYLCKPDPLFRINEVDQVTHIVHIHDFTQFKFNPEGAFHLADQLDMAQRIPLFNILGCQFSSNSNVLFLENFLEHSFQPHRNFFIVH